MQTNMVPALLHTARLCTYLQYAGAVISLHMGETATATFHIRVNDR